MTIGNELNQSFFFLLFFSIIILAKEFVKDVKKVAKRCSRADAFPNSSGYGGIPKPPTEIPQKLYLT